MCTGAPEGDVRTDALLVLVNLLIVFAIGDPGKGANRR
jgi:hypothetical protein